MVINYINYPLYSSDAFSWKGNTGTAEASALKMAKLKVVTMQGIGNGIFVVSTATGQRRFFGFVPDEDNYDGEFQLFENSGIFVQIWNY
jgi:hypothetical protein